jgi:hypothetical protein
MCLGLMRGNGTVNFRIILECTRLVLDLKPALSFANANARYLGVNDQLKFSFDSWVIGGGDSPVFPCT